MFVINPSFYLTRWRGYTYKLLSESGEKSCRGHPAALLRMTHSETLKIGRGFNFHQTQNHPAVCPRKDVQPSSGVGSSNSHSLSLSLYYHVERQYFYPCLPSSPGFFSWDPAKWIFHLFCSDIWRQVWTKLPTLSFQSLFFFSWHFKDPRY